MIDISKVESSVPSLSIGEDDQIRFFQVLVHATGEEHFVTRVDTGQTVRTSALGAQAVKLLRRGRTVRQVKEHLAKETAIPVEDIDVSPLLSALAASRMLRRLGSISLETRADGLLRRSRRGFLNMVAAKSSSWLIHNAPVSFTFGALYRATQEPSSDMLLRIQQNLQSVPALGLAPDALKSVARWNCRLIERTAVDRVFLAAFNARKLRTLFGSYMEVTGREHLDRALTAGHRVILCGFHTGSYSVLPYLLAVSGYAVSALIHADRGGQWAAEQTVAHLQKAGLPHNLELAYGMAGIRKLRCGLNSGRAALIFPDALTEEAQGTNVPFLGSIVRAAPGIAWLFNQHNSVIIPCYLRTDLSGFHRLTLGEPLSPAEGAEAVMEAVFDRLAQAVSAEPGQWIRWIDFDRMLLKPEGSVAELDVSDHQSDEKSAFATQNRRTK